MIRSLRWRLQIWHALILTAAITIFGAAFYLQLRRSTFGEIDLELLSSARVLEGALRTMPPRMLEEGFPPPSLSELNPMLGPPPSRGPDGPVGPGPGNRSSGGPAPRGPGAGNLVPGNMGPGVFGPGPGGMGGGRVPPADGRGDRQRHIPPRGMDNSYLHRGERLGSVLSLPARPMRGPHDDPSYFAIFSPSGSLLKSEPEGLEINWSPPSRPVAYYSLQDHREVWVRGPSATLIVVGRDVRHPMDRLTNSLIQLILGGLSVSVLGLVGGWWLSGRAIRPITQISETASKITASNLEQRIDTSAMDAELQGLGGILNSMFVRLQKSFEQQSRFTADASHELRTPLAVILSHCELALNRARTAEDYKQTIATCQKAGERMRSLVEDLLTLARADAGKLEMQSSPVDLHAIASEVVAMFEPTSLSRQITLSITGDSAVCNGDPARLTQVVTNLVSNAIHYNRDGGKVSLRTVMEGTEAVLWVEDTGCGIPESAIAKLFDRFYRVDEARSRQTGGSGLGLAICKSIIDAHGGQIQITSQLDAGSTFEIRIPVQSSVESGVKPSV